MEITPRSQTKDRRFRQFLEEELLKFESVGGPTDRIAHTIPLKPVRQLNKDTDLETRRCRP